ncbi:MAG TPA: ABC transporter transmembrane domain-containing protein, partial [Methylophilaceae bacterium]|nr:ABC transporter transmembrane domain-containing protein [Methylophilaceae bacterium]
MREYLLGCRKNFLYAGIFSFFVNILTLSVSIYMLQVFDRVFTSRSQETLLMLTIIAVGALLVMMALDILRSRLLLAAGVALDSALGPKVLKTVLESASRGSGVESVSSLREVAMVRGFLTGQGIISLFDIPWLPFYVFVIFLFHPVLGISALVSAALLLLLAWLNEKFTRRPIEETGTRSRHAAKFIDGGIRNAEVVSALGMLPAVTKRWSQLNKKVIVAQVEAGYRSGLLIGISKFTRMMVQVGMMGLGAWLVIHQHLTAGGMMATTIILARALQPVESAIASWKGFVDARSAYNRLDEMLGKL